MRAGSLLARLCVKACIYQRNLRVCACAADRGREVIVKKPDRCVSGSLCVDLGRRLLYITFKADNIIAWPDK